MSDGSDGAREPSRDGFGSSRARSGEASSASLEAGLQHLSDMVADAKTMPLSASIMLNKAELEALVGELREALPEELRQARWVLKERDDILDKAQAEAERIRDEAEEERDRMLSRTEVVKAADREAERILEDARDRARQLRLEAEDYVDAKLANFEVVLQKTLQAVERGRDKLQGTLHSEQLADETLVDDDLDEDLPASHLPGEGEGDRS